jgi:hypothetical protein
VGTAYPFRMNDVVLHLDPSLASHNFGRRMTTTAPTARC